MPTTQITSSKFVIYQMMTRLFGNTNTTNKKFGTLQENGVGKFNDINDVALDAIKQLGVTHIWYTGVIEHALLTDYTSFNIPLDDADVVKGRAGSPYAIKDYYDINPDLAVDVKNRMAEFEQLVARTH
jgi:glycosidase